MIKKRLLVITLILCSILINVNAQTNTTGLETFESIGEEITDISPPSPPEIIEEIPKKFSLYLELKDYNTKELVNDIHVNIEIYDITNKKETKTLQYVDEKGVLKLKLYPGNWKIKLKVDKLDTNGKDYFIEKNFVVNSDLTQTIYLLPIGSVRGIVYDNKEKAVKNANLKFECSANYGETNQKTTDSFGSFTSYWLPIGSCKISAQHNNEIGSEQVNIQQGKLIDSEIRLDKRIASSKLNIYIGIFIVLVLSIIYYLKRGIKLKKIEAPKKLLEEKKIKEDITKVELSSRTRDLINTLKDKERIVVDFLLENKYNSSQAKIRNATGIPKTSLTRLFVSLETKKIITVEKIGKLKKIKLTDWFLGKG